MATRNQVYFLEDDDLWEEQSLLFAPPSPIRASDDEDVNSMSDVQNSVQDIMFDDVLVAVVQILPDIDPSFVRERFDHLPNSIEGDKIQYLLSSILEGDYPKVGKKRKREESPKVPKVPKEQDIDYASTNRVSFQPHYRHIASDVLSTKFPDISMAMINGAFALNKKLYAPTYIHLHNLDKQKYTPMKRPRAPKPRLELDLQTLSGMEVSHEMAWVEAYLEKQKVEEDQNRRKKQEEDDAEAARQLNFKEHEASGGLLECGCCFDECPANTMTACAEGHVFCLECAKRNADTTVGSGGYIFKCMDVSGCKAEFTSGEISRFADEKTLALRDKLAAGDALREASIDGLVTCPFCDFGAIVENENDKEFRCQNKECQIISCRLCRLESHIPLSCEEFRKENKLSAKHAVEEAMSDALIQKCNKCSKPFVKLYGCNKMTCPCGNLQCYVCGKSIQDYRHFERPEGPNGTKCPLHEKDDSRLEKKLRDAQDQAVKKVLEETSDVEEEDVRVPLNPVHMTVPPNPQNIPHVAALQGGGYHIPIHQVPPFLAQNAMAFPPQPRQVGADRNHHVQQHYVRLPQHQPGPQNQPQAVPLNYHHHPALRNFPQPPPQPQPPRLHPLPQLPPRNPQPRVMPPRQARGR